MRKWVNGVVTAVVAAVLVMGLPTGAVAQDYEFGVEGSVGSALPTGDLSRTSDPGFGGGLGLVWRSHERFWLRADVDYNMYGGEPGYAGPGGNFPDITAISFTAGPEFNLLSDDIETWRLSTSVGFGFTHFKVDAGANPDAKPEISETYFQTRGGFNLGYAVTPTVDVFLDTQVQLILSDEDDFVNWPKNPAEGPGRLLDASLWSAPMSLGVRYNF